MRIVSLESESIHCTLHRPQIAHDWASHARSTAAEVLPRLQGAQVAIVNKVPLPRAVLEALPDLKLVAVSATGTNNVDLEACRALGIAVTNVRGYARHTLPEHVFALLLALSRNLIAYREAVQQGAWQQSDQFCCFGAPIRDLHGATLGVVGRGSLGDGVVRLGEAFGMRVLVAERKDAPETRPGYTPFAQVIAEADALSLHCPLTEATRHLIGAAEFRAMKPTALLINTGRGGLVDEQALITALQTGQIAGAGFDVLTQEPPTDDHPLLAPEVLALPNFILTPHIAWASGPAMQDLWDETLRNIEAFSRGEARNRVV